MLPSARLPFYLGLFLVSCSVLTLEVLDTRLLSVLTWYSLAFFVIAMGLFGLTAGAIQVYLRHEEYAGERLCGALARDALQLALAVPVSFVLLLIVPLRAEAVATTVPLFVLFAAAVALPFYPAGKVVAAALTCSPLPVGRVYAVDLLGAALGAPLVPMLLERLGGSAILSVSVLAAIASFAFAQAAADRTQTRRAVVAMLGAFLLVGANAASSRGLVPLWAKGRPEARDQVERELWNSHSRVQVSPPAPVLAALWGKGDKCNAGWVLQRAAEIDAHAATPLYLVGKNLESLRFLDCDVSNAVHCIRPRGPIAIVGVGGSRDIQSALLAGHGPVVGIELNARLLELVRGPLGKDTGVADRSDVVLVHDEARSFLSRSQDRFAVIQASLIDTWAATGAGAHALGENGLYTVEAFGVFLDRLEPGGILSVSRWLGTETDRLVAVAMAALLARGVVRPREHIALLRAGVVSTLLVARDPLSEADRIALEAVSAEKGFSITALPGRAALAQRLEGILAATDRAALDRRALSVSLDLRPTTDERPFFFNVVRLGAALGSLPAGADDVIAIEGNLIATRTLLLSFVAALVLVLGAIAVPLLRRARLERALDAPLVAGLAYFALIGVGFMLAEIALLQRLSLVLGHPSYSLMVVLSSLVGAMGIGSLVSDRLPLDRAPWCYVFPLFIAAVLAGVALGWPRLSAGIAAAPTGTRICFAIALCGVVGVFAGCAFPAGMRLAQRSLGAETPWLWGINGVGSVLASSLAILIALTHGLTTLMLAGAALYVLLVPAVYVLLRPAGQRS